MRRGNFPSTIHRRSAARENRLRKRHDAVSPGADVSRQRAAMDGDSLRKLDIRPVDCGANRHHNSERDDGASLSEWLVGILNDGDF